MRLFELSTAVAALLVVQSCVAYNILGVFPVFSKSHYIAGGALMRSLAADGHNVTVISPYPNEKPIPNFRHIDVVGVDKAVKGMLPTALHLHQASAFESIAQIYHLSAFVTNYTLKHPVMTAFLADKTEHFDLVIIESSLTEALYGLGPHFNAPIVGFSPLGSSLTVAALVGTPTPMSYVPHLFLSYTDQMTITQRIVNALVTWVERTLSWRHAAVQEEIFKEVFKQQQSVEEAKKSVALVLLNQHFSTSFPRPYVPNMIEVGGIQINRNEPKQLPDDIREFVEGAEHGVVYLSLGTNILSSELPLEVRNAMLRSMGKLKQRVLWKWEQTDLPGQPANVLIKKWFPQDDVLAHPNVKLFITHGGLLGLSEAVYHGLPVIGIPFFADQSLNLARATSRGFGITIAYSNLTETSLSWALNEMFTNPSYTENAKIISTRYRDQPMKPMDLAKYWVEYVIRHKGAPHMKSAALELSLLQYYSVDVFALLAAVVVIWFYLVWLASVWLCCRQKSDKSAKIEKLKKK